MASGWLPTPAGLPYAPRNATVTSPFIRGAWDIRWDDPAVLCENADFTIVGVNVYRSESSDRGPYYKVNPFPVGSSFYRDATTTVLVNREVVDWGSAWVHRGDGPNYPEWVFQTRWPIVKKDSRNVPADSPFDVVVAVNGIPVEVNDVYGLTHSVRLANVWLEDPASEGFLRPDLPTADSEVTVTYYRSLNTVQTDLGTKTFYRVTTVAVAPGGQGLVETPLQFSPPLASFEVEPLDWIWKEAVRRNKWILQQGGERVKLFVRKTNGVVCQCSFGTRALEYQGNPAALCRICFGTGIRGGYDGPYDIIIGPDEAEKRLSRSMQGQRIEHQYDVWTSPYPVITQRDFLVKQTNERYSVGAVTRPSNRGMNLQQSFPIKYLDEKDIRYTVPITGTDALAWPQTRYTDDIVTGDPCMTRHNFEGQPIPTGPSAVTPMQTENGDIADNREIRGRTPAWENATYGGSKKR